MISLIQAAVLGALQGITELFPISSLGHSVILPKLFGWNLDQSEPSFLAFLIATHLATAIVLFFFFFKDWIQVFKGLGRVIRDRKIDASDAYAKLGVLLVVGTIPAGILGLMLEKPIRALFSTPLIAAVFLIVNGLVLFTAERLRRRQRTAVGAQLSASAGTVREVPADAAGTKGFHADDWASDAEISTALSWRQALGIGAAQAAALLPGISRSGASMVGGLLCGLSNESAARFSFLLATPVIGAAAVLKLPELFGPAIVDERGAFIMGALCAAVAAWFATKFLLRFFETRTLMPFAIYCVVGGVVYFCAMLITG
ncbi:undecaprenyl-diphosphate phosphatase [Pseudarthrobacter phenanthrenivorans]|uniref:undecaprenyl-diphosphate phosphatase n=1 Tax=Pseudarthrobacter phenanthrenivorans TaxID=361575 RepID=UPI002F35ADEE